MLVQIIYNYNWKGQPYPIIIHIYIYTRTRSKVSGIQLKGTKIKIHKNIILKSQIFNDVGYNF